VPKDSKNYEEDVIVTRKGRGALDVYTLEGVMKYVFLIMNALQEEDLEYAETCCNHNKEIRSPQSAMIGLTWDKCDTVAESEQLEA